MNSILKLSTRVYSPRERKDYIHTYTYTHGRVYNSDSKIAPRKYTYTHSRTDWDNVKIAFALVIILSRSCHNCQSSLINRLSGSLGISGLMIHATTFSIEWLYFWYSTAVPWRSNEYSNGDIGIVAACILVYVVIVLEEIGFLIWWMNLELYVYHKISLVSYLYCIIYVGYSFHCKFIKGLFFLFLPFCPSDDSLCTAPILSIRESPVMFYLYCRKHIKKERGSFRDKDISGTVYIVYFILGCSFIKKCN